MVIASGMKLLVAGAKTICRLWKNVGKNRMDTEVLRDRLDFVQTAAIDASHGSGYARTLEPTVDGISEEVRELENASNTDGVTRIGNVRRIMSSDMNREDISNLNDRLDRLTSDMTMAAAVETQGAVREMSTSLESWMVKVSALLEVVVFLVVILDLACLCILGIMLRRDEAASAPSAT